MVYICQKCKDLGGVGTAGSHDESSSFSSSSSSSAYCCVCLGTFSTNFAHRLETAIQAAMEPYNSNNNEENKNPVRNNRFSRQLSPPQLVLPGDLVARFRAYFLETKNPAVVEFTKVLKQETKTILNECLDRLEGVPLENNNNNNKSLLSTSISCYPPCVEQEELGYLGVHVIVLPKIGISRPPPSRQRLDQRKKYASRQGRKKTHASAAMMMMNGGPQQGGDPRHNHEARVLAARPRPCADENGSFGNNNNNSLWTLNQALEEEPSNNNNNSNNNKFEWIKDDHATMNKKNDDDDIALDISVAVYRRQFYLTGFYTKSRRDVSQTPFYVTTNDSDNKRQKLGVTSVEEQILPAMVKYCAAGISTRNNSPANSHVLYGMAKFHASGREDMDVRMIVPSLLSPITTTTRTTTTTEEKAPPTTTTSKIQRHQVKITGRPFVCEIIDALSMPLPSDLAKIVAEINHEHHNNNSMSNQKIDQDPLASSVTATGGDGDGDNVPWYGQNPMGVGIAPDLEFCSSADFTNLQTRTESKVKLYGCLCWSRNKLPDAASHDGGDDEALNMHLFGHAQGLPKPLELQQQTPLRVLHRRSNMVRIRHVLTCRANCVDEHHFRLHLSTDAGTYVKEFVHGDLRRTVPSMATLAGCKTDILELDCEGIQFDED